MKPKTEANAFASDPSRWWNQRAPMPGDILVAVEQAYIAGTRSAASNPAKTAARNACMAFSAHLMHERPWLHISWSSSVATEMPIQVNMDIFDDEHGGILLDCRGEHCDPPKVILAKDYSPCPSTPASAPTPPAATPSKSSAPSPTATR